MSTISKAILGFAVLGAVGAATMIEPSANPRMPAPAPASLAAPAGKISARLPGAEAPKLSGEQVMLRIRAAHGLDRTGETVAALDCKAFSWPNIPAECIAGADSGQTRRPVRVISMEARAAAPATAAVIVRQPEAKVVRN